MGAYLRCVLWPAFLLAISMEILVFAVVDPMDLSWQGQPVMWSRSAVYSIAFFCFWAIGLIGCGVTYLLARTPGEVDGHATPLSDSSRSSHPSS